MPPSAEGRAYDALVRVWGPEGDRYRVKRRWLPWRQRRRSVDRSNLDLVGSASAG